MNRPSKGRELVQIGFRLEREEAERLQRWMSLKGFRRYADLVEFLLREHPATDEEIRSYVETLGAELREDAATKETRAKPRRSR